MKKLVLVLVLGTSTLGCKDGGSSPASPSNAPASTPAPQGPTQAAVSVAASNGAVLASGAGNLVQLLVVMQETAGVGVNINYLRLDIFRATGEFEERAEIGAADIIAGVGDNRLDANSTESATVTFFFRATVKKGRQMLLTINATDDRGNNLEATFPYILS